MRRHSPYNYAFNNPVFFIDPDGMMPGVPEIGSLAFHGAKDFSADFGEVEREAEKSENSQSSNNAQSYSNFFHNVAVQATQANGGGCPDGVDCDERELYNGPSVAVGTDVVNSMPEVTVSSKVNNNVNTKSTNNLSNALGAFELSLGGKNNLIEFAGKGGDLSPGTIKYLKYSKGLGYVGAGINTYFSLNQYIETPTAGNATRLAVQGFAIGTAFIPGVGWAISLGIGTADMIWGDDFYNWIDNH